MKNILTAIILTLVSFLTLGCEGIRFAPGQVQKQNAWLHARTAAVAADTAKEEDASTKLQSLTRLSEIQSRAINSYYGQPSEFPQAGTAEEILNKSNFQLARTALRDSSERPGAFALADSMLEVAIGVCALMGGVYGAGAVRFLKQARTKSHALQEIIAGNELFKRQNPIYIPAFKTAHKDQSPQTKAIVAQTKA